ncbi:hypothetical protein DFH11DRAFT_1724073 [Phellopilus nigrolimitatus]|nr:hypothetical protein DFH11DRAFT_1724073 [Phellopilus nigrolimitatus]
MSSGSMKEWTSIPDSSVSEGESSRSSGSNAASSASSLRYRRELRYSRDEQALTTNLNHCTSEPSQEELQIKALERVGEQLNSRARESQQRILQLRVRLSSKDVQNHDLLQRQRILEERRLAAACKEQKSVAEQLIQLRQSRLSPFSQPADGSVSRPARGSRSNANLNLFLQKSPTKRPLQTHSSRPHSVDSLPIGIVSSGRNSVSDTLWKRHYQIQPRSKSLIEKTWVDKLHRDEGNAAQTALRSTSSDSKEGTFSNRHEPDMHGCADVVIPAVDEFTNSFSSRVIMPAFPRPKRNTTLRSLRVQSRQRTSIFDGPVRTGTTSSEYGNVTILPKTLPRPNAEVLGELSDVPLPSYVQSLIDGFDQTRRPSLSLNISELEVQRFRRPVPLSPLLEQPSPLSSVAPLPSPKPSMRKPVKKQRSIFTLRLPMRPSVPESASRSTLAASSSTSLSELTAVDHSSSLRSPKSTTDARSKGLPSTRNYDLSQLDRARGDVPGYTDSFTLRVPSPFDSKEK